jgi:hypothetical protein
LVTVVALVWLSAIAGLATVDADWARTVRVWLPLVYIVASYWLPAQLVVKTNTTFERILLSLDRRWFGATGLATFRQRAPRVAICLELAYLACYPLVPLGFFCLALAGDSLRDGDRFWACVLGAALPCYGSLPWLPTRPPRAVETVDHAESSIREINVRVLSDVSVGWNTFPSGHAAASVATACALAPSMPIVALGFAVVAVGICAGSVVGRYHYAADAVAGIALAGLAFVLSHGILS